jgi:hypothetical protein
MKTKGELSDTELQEFEAQYAALLAESKCLIDKIYQLHPTRKDPYNRHEVITPEPTPELRKRIEDVMQEEWQTRWESGTLKTFIEREYRLRNRTVGKLIKDWLS